jgi:hypothetical protein
VSTATTTVADGVRVVHCDPIAGLGGQPTLDPLQAVSEAVAFSSRDWSNDGRDAAWIFGIVCGWDGDPDDPEAGDAMAEVAARYHWDDATVARLRGLRAAWQALEEAPRD